MNKNAKKKMNINDIANMVNKDSGYDDNDDEFDCPICNVVIAIKMLDFEDAHDYVEDLMTECMGVQRRTLS